MKKNALPTIVVLYNQVSDPTNPNLEATLADDDTVWAANEVQNALNLLGYTTKTLAVTLENLPRLGKLSCDLIFNLSEGIGALPKSDYLVAKELEEAGRAFTGCGSQALHFTNDKIATKDLLLAHGLPTPAYQVFSTSDISSFSLHFPVIVKPSKEDSSLGIGGDSVAVNKIELQKKVNALEQRYADPILVEEYIDGRELNVTIVGYGEDTLVLPTSEIMFSDWFNDKYKVVDFAAKWEEETPSYKNSWGVSPAALLDNEKKLVEEVSLKAYHLTSCQGYGRIDIRLGKDGIPYILEVNANPGIAPDTGAVRSAKAAGYSYEQFLELIIKTTQSYYAKKEQFSQESTPAFAFS